MKTTHNMNLNNAPFNRIKDGTKTIELRLKPKDMEKYYSKEEQDKYGVIGIEVRVIEDRK